MGRKTSEFEQEMRQLDAELKRLEAEYNMFFAGRLPRLPWETRARVDALVTRYDRMALSNTAQRFRFSTLQARYTAFCELWARALKRKEEGRPAPRRSRAAGVVAAPSPAAPPPKVASRPPASGVIHVAAFRHPARESDRLMELYSKLSEARQATGEHPVAFDRLVEVVHRQIDRLGGLNAEVVFRVIVEDGKVTLTAKRREMGR